MKTTDRLTDDLLEMADGMLKLGVMDRATHKKITRRHLAALPQPMPLSAAEIRGIRERAHLSQAALAHVLGISPGYISRLERGEKKPSGATLALFSVIKRKGIEVIF